MGSVVATGFSCCHFFPRMVYLPPIEVGVKMRPQLFAIPGVLLPKTLQENGVKLAPFSWRVKDFRDLNQYMSTVI